MKSGLSQEELELLSKVSAVSRPDRERYPFEKHWPENVWAIGLNRLDLPPSSGGYGGIYQHCNEAHLRRYLAEFDFRYNNRVALGYNDADRSDPSEADEALDRLVRRDGVKQIGSIADV